MKALQFFPRGNGRALATTFLATLVLVCAAALAASAQSGAMSPYQGESDGVSAGGKWMEFHSEEKMTGAKKVRFELLSDNYLSEDPDYKPRIELVCSNGKYTYADFNPGIRLGPPNRPGFWGTAPDGSHGPRRRRAQLPRLELDSRPFPLYGQRHYARVDRSSRVQGANPRPKGPRNRGILAHWLGPRPSEAGLRSDSEDAQQGLNRLLFRLQAGAHSSRLGCRGLSCLTKGQFGLQPRLVSGDS